MLSMGVVRGISYGLFGPPDDFGEGARGLNASQVRAYVYWHQVEPEPGRFDWTLVDRLLGQVAGWGRLWLTVCSSSPWATRTPTTFLPPSPPKDLGAYTRFIAELVRHCDGQVDYWQCENEPSNSGLLWAGTAEEYAEVLARFGSAVRSVPSAGRVVLGGVGYDVLSEAPGTDAWRSSRPFSRRRPARSTLSTSTVTTTRGRSRPSSRRCTACSNASAVSSRW